MPKNQHVVKRQEGWAVRGEGNSKDTSHHRTQEDARKAAREIAKNQRSEVVIHRPNGRIRDKDSYGNDPHPPKG
jgi:inhibitor of KinA sporulation pathway (predicted exonuclease)